MPTYEIKAPNGKLYRIDGPAGATDEQVRQQVLRQFPDAAKVPQRNTYPTLSQSTARKTYENARQSLIGKITDTDAQARALKRFETDPRIQTIREKAGYAPTESRQRAVKDIARQSVASLRNEKSAIPLAVRDVGAGIGAAANTALFGLPARGVAAVKGIPNDVAQAVMDEQGARAPVTNFLGTLLASLATGSAIGRGAATVGGRIATSASPTVAKIGRATQAATQLRKGQTVRNVARISGAGAAGGLAQSVGEGRNYKENVIAGAVGAPLITYGAKGVVGTAKFLRNSAGFKPVEQILGQYISTSMDDIAKAMATRQAQGLKSTIYEVLPLADRQALDDAIARMPGKARERVAALVNQRAEDMVKETSGRVQQIIRPFGPEKIRSKIAADLAASRGAGSLPTEADIKLAESAARSPLDMRKVRKQEAANIMAPYDNMPAFESVSDLVPQVPENVNGTIIMRETKPEIGATIRRAAGALRIKEDNLTFRDVTQIMRHLTKQQGRGGIEGDAAATALNHISDVVADQHPKVAPAIQKMRDTYAARRRMSEGVTEGARTRRRVDVDETTPDAAQKAINAYDTPEGTAGRALGQAQQLERDILASPSQSLRALENIASNPSQRLAISENLGNNAGEQIAEVARMQSQSANRLAGLDKETAQRGLSSLDLMQNLMMLGPSTLPVTKIRAVSNLVKGTLRIPEAQATKLADMLFSTNPTQISQAIRAITKYGAEGDKLIRDIGREIGLGNAVAASLPEDTGAPPLAPEIDQGGEDQMDEEMQVADGDYAGMVDQLYASESPELLDLIDRVAMQESGARQLDEQGNPITSPKGAIGIMQVMPQTAPEAAQLAGLPWDEEAYRTDENYNRLLGVAYLSEMLRRYDGDAAKALAAYNAGPGRLNQALARDEANWLAFMPAETQDYVENILS